MLLAHAVMPLGVLREGNLRLVEEIALAVIGVVLVVGMGMTLWSWRRRMDPSRGGRNPTKFFF